mmetsp:Transcript_48324/g.121665  ORF Transcript_48324/g.121665 Transcript_48324/m.121665 type:complete len:173 (-) Transcript_48324:126-644(-)
MARTLFVALFLLQAITLAVCLSPVVWDPFKDFEDFFPSRFISHQPVLRVSQAQRQREEREHVWAPLVDVKETEKNLVIQAELPGVKKEDLKVEVENGRLTISGQRHRQTEEKGENYHRMECSYGSFSRSFSIPDISGESVAAKYTDGVLTLTLPKPEKVQPKKHVVDIKSEL